MSDDVKDEKEESLDQNTILEEPSTEKLDQNKVWQKVTAVM